MIEPVSSATVAAQITTNTCARRSVDSGRAATTRTTQVRAPSTSCPWRSTCVSTASSVARNAAIAALRPAASPAHGLNWSSCHDGTGASSSSARSPFGIAVAEVGHVLVPRDLEEALLDAVVEPRAAEDEFLEPVDERLAADERHALPVPDEVAAELAPRLVDPVTLDELDEIARSRRRRARCLARGRASPRQP